MSSKTIITFLKIQSWNNGITNKTLKIYGLIGSPTNYSKSKLFNIFSIPSLFPDYPWKLKGKRRPRKKTWKWMQGGNRNFIRMMIWEDPRCWCNNCLQHGCHFSSAWSFFADGCIYWYKRKMGKLIQVRKWRGKKRKRRKAGGETKKKRGGVSI